MSRSDDIAKAVKGARAGDEALTLGRATTTDYRKTFFDAHPELRTETLVVHHAVEQRMLKKYPDLFDPLEIHSLENLRGIPFDQNRVLHLSEIRKDWNQFYIESETPGDQADFG